MLDNNFKERQEFKRTKNFAVLMTYMVKNKLFKGTLLGDHNYLTNKAQAAFNSNKDKQGVMSYYYWEQFYYGIPLPNNVNDEYILKTHGRSFRQLRESAMEIKIDLNDHYELNIPIKQIEDALIIVAIDDPYLLYIQKINTIISLSNRYPNHIISFSNLDDNVNFGIDLIIKNSNNDLVGAFTVRTKDFHFGRISKKQPYLSEYLDIYKLHREYSKQTNVIPQFLISDTKGKITSPIHNIN